MSIIKGCINPDCEAYIRKRNYKEKDTYCSECGKELAFVCKKCHTRLTEPKKYCVLHESKKRDKTNNTKNVLLGAASIAVTAATIIKKYRKK